MSVLADFASSVRERRPRLAVVLGSGQSSVLRSMQETAAIPFADVPGVPAPTVVGHSGRIVLGDLESIPVLVFQGRVHFYEGHSWDKVAAPVRFAADLGITTLLLTNAAGGIHPSLTPGSMMILRDHLFWQRPETWRGPTPADCPSLLGDRPSPYSSRLIGELREASRGLGEPLHEGIYAAMTGPTYETPAEILALQKAGADAAGMSTAFEAETGQSMGMECAAISAITNKGAGLDDSPLLHHDVLNVMNRIRDRLGLLIAAFTRRIS